MAKKIKIKKPKSMIFRGIGKTPSIDWLIIGAIFIFLVIAAVAWSAVQFAETKNTLQADDTVTNAAPVPLTKTEEEQAREILEIYGNKGERHTELLGKTKSDTAIEKKNIPVVATSTATSTPAAATSTDKAR